jgi:hypothetical protein
MKSQRAFTSDLSAAFVFYNFAAVTKMNPDEA